MTIEKLTYLLADVKKAFWSAAMETKTWARSTMQTDSLASSSG